jgi:mannose-6-phosphate isomerase-like protein (cupin superfamily)
VAAVRTAGEATRDEALATFRAEGCSAPRHWSNAPGDRYGSHAHHYDKVLYCLEGSIVFHMADGDVELTAGDRLDIGAGTDHAATVGPDGCACVESTA